MNKIRFIFDAYTLAFKELVYLSKLVITEKDFDSFVEALNGKELKTKGNTRVADVNYQGYDYALLYSPEFGCEIGENI